MIFVPFWSSNAHISYRIQALHSNIDQNMEQVQRGIFYWDQVRIDGLTAQPQLTSRWQFTVWSWGSLYMLTCDLEIVMVMIN